MKLRFFVVPMLDGDEASQELNRFLSTNRVLLVERHFVSDGPRSAWAICVSYLDRGGRPAPELCWFSVNGTNGLTQQGSHWEQEL